MSLLVYILHCGQLYGTERMALATLGELWGRADVMLLAPEGPVHFEAARLGIKSKPYRSMTDLAGKLWHLLASPGTKVCTTSVSQSLITCLLGAIRRHVPRQVHIVHGGTDEHLSYGRKHWLQPLGIELVAVSAYVRERLLAHHCVPRQITVIENFLSGAYPERGVLRQLDQLRVCMITRLDPIKQVGVAIDAWNAMPSFGRPHLRVCGTGWQLEELLTRAAVNADIELLGYVSDTRQELLRSDLYLHTCGAEPFGLAILEAMVVGVPVLVPDTGGASLLVEPGVNGFCYRTGDALDLQRQIEKIAAMSAEELNAIVAQARRMLRGRFSASERANDYAALLGLEARHAS
ncbi:glycosyltransferase family 4 protein [Chitinilyticum piscinae]|uniref:Glycosyltransferase family 4 protein n=1 Tax=Chitinilyticum piscinae TaxID=2866724 RepID=A0A8J7K8I6_9NEIS|nr:glycosyltransferase family 4 protein [Chitinilyticum piscinae]MBE9609568.1 glycosyltransferase family 4 protein [Chitinilyticum piscinae]